MGKKPVFGLVGACWFGLALAGCETTSGGPKAQLNKTPTFSKNTTGQSGAAGTAGVVGTQQGVGQQAQATGTPSTGTTGVGNVQQPQGSGIQPVAAFDTTGPRGSVQALAEPSFQERAAQQPPTQFRDSRLAAPTDTQFAPSSPKPYSGLAAPTGTGAALNYSPASPLSRDDGLGGVQAPRSDLGRGSLGGDQPRVTGTPPDTFVPPPPASVIGTGSKPPAPLPPMQPY